MAYLHDYKIDTSYNLTSIKQMLCVCCGKKYAKDSRIDTVDLFNVDESFCLIHWWKHILDIKHLCLKSINYL